MRSFVVAALAASALAACGPPPKVIKPAELPHVKAGLWAETVSDNGTTMEPSKDCSDGTLRLPGALMPARCASQPLTTLDSKGEIAVDWSCSAGGMTTILHTTVSGDFNASYAIDSKTTTTASGGAPQVTTVHETFKYLGPCPPESAAPDAPPD
ncbi:MAG TPA: hypothetical protein VKT30_15780 [Caulobacteraceae bacterium]|nr:hypothetical protein [Caulobacteraceae bacterium]